MVSICFFLQDLFQNSHNTLPLGVRSALGSLELTRPSREFWLPYLPFRGFLRERGWQTSTPRLGRGFSNLFGQGHPMENVIRSLRRVRSRKGPASTYLPNLLGSPQPEVRHGFFLCCLCFVASFLCFLRFACWCASYPRRWQPAAHALAFVLQQAAAHRRNSCPRRW